MPPSDRQLILLARIDDCYRALSGHRLYCPDTIADRYRWLHTHAPYAILAHDAGTDPVFFYANRCALNCFKYSEREMLSLPSRLSAGPSDRTERQRLLETVTRNGLTGGYSGPRVDKLGNSFLIHDGEIWQLGFGSAAGWGQAALFWPSPRQTVALD
ncbi:MEKHLA domain-containing protein [Xanthomonas rydalmerensis]|uniref:MEKHLA domain-containing protein n=1 Tax=Xanthomonas rydalmerensis TaxID=3046274 RepID=A0ABZ0JMC4_9XANT|nr:MEKHLA domain-containing protein [Xanthomonas sp. DM-2023]WOS40973.1 MEKHLA domain-containing protein [Xanthomonas sp. DM-2023]WOS45158.1 MEKHLA domain-containing protein [Xanthomonas sp. DM-2023]WOS49337.1 MEKHLA domain-containing protein [Xanthomonas sp. DM-2023]WOS53517.1 MEKHLA domain-containing protein [Xanthomonas sp. DM-2023]WOS57700.1 MEKHLA domain-containing protein [Xanthomonas sp. DM-2023]